MVRSLSALLAVDPGMQTAGVTAAMLPLPVNRYPTLGQQADALSERPAEDSTAARRFERRRRLPAPVSSRKAAVRRSAVEGLPPSSRANRPGALFNAALAGVLPHSSAIPLLRGRDFQETDRENSVPVAIVSRAFVERFLAGNRIRSAAACSSATEPFTIVGSRRRFSARLARSASGAVAFVPYRQFSLPFMSVLVRSAAPHAAVTTLIRQAMGEIDRDLALAEVNTLEDMRSRSTAPAQVPRAGTGTLRRPCATARVHRRLWSC